MAESRIDGMKTDGALGQKALDIAFDLRDVPVHQRQTEIAARCGSNQTLAKQVSQLLMAADLPDEAFERPFIVSPFAEAPDTPAPSIPGYTLEAQIGRGGMGVVYRACDETNADRPVALKVLPPLRDEAARIRFGDECAAMARLVHPHIAVLYQSGMAEDRPFVAMEHVDGLRIDHYCNENRLTIKQRLRLIEQVCQAIAYAHERGILHQDLKPANVLVTTGVDHQPAVKVIDFGIATQFQDGSHAAPGKSAAGSLAYVSPERAADPMQFRADVREDVYAIGVILFELLTGRHALDAERLVASASPQRADPSSLRQMLQALPAKDIASMAERRQTTVRQWTKRLGPDLDAIVKRAIHPDRSQRYRSPLDLHADLVALKAHQPVSARDTSTAYLTGRFIRRRWGLVTGVAVVLTSLVLGLISTQFQARRAELARAESEQVTQFVTRIFSDADPAVKNPVDITALDLLESGREQAEAELAAQPAILGRVLGVIGTAYYRLGKLDVAETTLQNALTLRDDETDQTTADTWLALADVQRRLAQHQAASESLDQAEAIYQQLSPVNQSGLANVLNSRGNLLFAQSLYAEAETVHREALALRTEVLGENALDTGVSANNVAAMLIMQRDKPGAEQYLLRANEVFSEQLPPTHAWIHKTRTNLATIWHQQARHSEAVAILEPVLANQIERLGEVHPEVIPTLTNLSDYLREWGRYEEAAAYMDRARQVAEQLYQAPHPQIAAILAKYGALEFAQWDVEAAERYYRQSMEMYASVYDDKHRMVTLQEQRIGRSLIRASKPIEAMVWLDQARKKLVEKVDEDHYWVLSLDRDRLTAVLDQGAPADWAEALWQRHQEAQGVRAKDHFDATYLKARWVAQTDPLAARMTLQDLLDAPDPDVPNWNLALAWSLLSSVEATLSNVDASESARASALELLDEQSPEWAVLAAVTP